jgi:ubiquinone/menaquinone biosynthesis C-methylase UbiE
VTGLLRDYSKQAETYDATRSASPNVVRALRAALDGAPGPRLADIGGGTGNYAHALREHGWQPLVIDREAAMLARAAAKGLETLRADAQRLPLPDGSFDAAMLVSMLHHVEDPARGVAEAKRVLRAGGRLAAMVYAREDIERLWCHDFWPSTRAWMLASHPQRADFEAMLAGARTTTIRMTDLADASLSVLVSHPELVLEERWRGQISYFERLERDHPDELRAGLAELRRAVEAGNPPRTVGTATLLAWAAPPAG